MQIVIEEVRTKATTIVNDGPNGGAVVIAASLLRIPLANAIVVGTEHNGLRIKAVTL